MLYKLLFFFLLGRCAVVVCCFYPRSKSLCRWRAIFLFPECDGGLLCERVIYDPTVSCLERKLTNFSNNWGKWWLFLVLIDHSYPGFFERTLHKILDRCRQAVCVWVRFSWEAKHWPASEFTFSEVRLWRPVCEITASWTGRHWFLNKFRNEYQLDVI